MSVRSRASQVSISITLAALIPAAAHAQSSVQLYGLVDATVGSFKASGSPTATVGLLSGGQTTSFYGIRGTEDLGGGFKSDFAIEGYFLVNNGESGRFAGDAAYSRNAYVDLASPYGTLRLGRLVTQLFYVTARTNPMGVSFRFSPLQTQLWIAAYGRTVLGDTGWDSAILYESPSIDGVKFSLEETVPGTGAHNESAALVYDQGPLYLGAVIQRVKHGLGITSTINRQETYFIGASYKLHFMRLFASYDHNAESNHGFVDNTYQAGFSIPVGFYILGVDYSRTNTPVSGGVPGYFRNTAGITLDRPISIRTDVYASYLFDRLSTAGSASSFGVGIRHVF